jgi:pyrroloquinoline-quinone synthase
MAERFARCPWNPEFDRFRKMILDQLVEEAGDPKGHAPGHPELWLKFCEGLGLSRESVQSATLLPSTLVAIDDFLYINRESPFFISAAGSSEPPNVELCQRLLPAFRRHYGVDEDHLTYYTLHVTADEDHSRFVGEMVAAFANNTETRRQMWDAMLRGFALHRLLVDGVLQDASENPN